MERQLILCVFSCNTILYKPISRPFRNLKAESPNSLNCVVDLKHRLGVLDLSPTFPHSLICTVFDGMVGKP